MKKKKTKLPEQEFVLGEKIRDVKINQKQHFLLFISMILFFNLLLMFSVGFVLIYLNRWYNWIICFALLFASFYLSFKEYRDAKTFHNCELYDNAVVINSIWFNIKVELKDIYEMRVKTSVLDKIFKINTKSLEVKILNRRRKKFTIHFIEENAVKLKQEIIQLIEKYTEKQNQNNLIAEEKTSAV